METLCRHIQDFFMLEKCKFLLLETYQSGLGLKQKSHVKKETAFSKADSVMWKLPWRLTKLRQKAHSSLPYSKQVLQFSNSKEFEGVFSFSSPQVLTLAPPKIGRETVSVFQFCYGFLKDFSAAEDTGEGRSSLTPASMDTGVKSESQHHQIYLLVQCNARSRQIFIYFWTRIGQKQFGFCSKNKVYWEDVLRFCSAFSSLYFPWHTSQTGWNRNSLEKERGDISVLQRGRKKAVCLSHPAPDGPTHCRALRVCSLKHSGSSERLCVPTNRKRHWLCFGNKHLCPSSGWLDVYIQLPPQLRGSAQACELTSTVLSLH